MGSLFGDTNLDLKARILEIARNAPESMVEVEAEKPLPEKNVQANGKVKVLMCPYDVGIQPTEFGRSGLFKLLPKTERRLVKNQFVECRSDIQLFFTGEELNVQDETVWMAILRLCRGKPLGERIFFTLAQLLGELKMRDTGGKTGSRSQVIKRLERLSIAHIKIELTRKDNKSVITTGLLKFGIEDETKKMYVRLDPDWAILFENLAYQNWETRLSLKSDISVRLLDYVCGHQSGKPHAQRLENLQKWLGYSGRPDKFRAAAMAGLKELEAAGVIRAQQVDKNTLRWTRI